MCSKSHLATATVVVDGALFRRWSIHRRGSGISSRKFLRRLLVAEVREA
jgi:hypothetical protein